MEKVAPLSTGAKIVLAAGSLLFVSLFLTWQAIPVKFGPKNTVTKGLDGWDAWGLFLGLAILALIALVIVRQYDEELAFDSRWSRVVLGLGGLVVVLAILKNLRDGDSTWASYLGVVLAGVVAAGAYLDYVHEPESVARAGSVWQPRDRSLEQASSRDEPTAPRW